MEVYFKAIGLQGWTNYTRAVRASMAGDYIYDKLDLVANAQERTNEVQEAEEALRNLGLNVQDMVAYMQATANGTVTPEMEARMSENMREASFTFVNDAVALPQSANRPLIYQDPRFAMFTQFQGFIATFTANHIPKMWGEYVKRGTPAMKYNAFAVMATMIVLGFASQYLKDLLKYGHRTASGDLRGAWDNPYLDKSETIQRGIRASGLLGSGERVLDQFMPIYEQRSKNPLDWAFKTASGEAPTLSNISRAGRAATRTFEGDAQEGIRQGLKVAPIVGPFSEIGSSLSKAVTGDWDFKKGGEY